MELFLQNAFLGSQLFDVGYSYVGHNGTVHPGHPGNALHLPGFAHPQLNDANLSRLRDLRNGNGHSHLAVAVARCLIDLESGAQGLRYHFPGSGLSHASRDSHQGQTQTFPAKTSQVLKGLLRVRHLNPRCLKGFPLLLPVFPALLPDTGFNILPAVMFAGKYHGRPAGNCLAEKAVGVHPLTHYGHKQVIPLHFSGIQADVFCMLILLAMEQVSSCGFKQFLNRYSCHTVSRLPTLLWFLQ